MSEEEDVCSKGTVKCGQSMRLADSPPKTVAHSPTWDITKDGSWRTVGDSKMFPINAIAKT